MWRMSMEKIKNKILKWTVNEKVGVYHNSISSIDKIISNFHLMVFTSCHLNAVTQVQSLEF